MCKIARDWVIDTDDMDEGDFVKFELKMSFGRNTTHHRRHWNQQNIVSRIWHKEQAAGFQMRAFVGQ